MFVPQIEDFQWQLFDAEPFAARVVRTHGETGVVEHGIEANETDFHAGIEFSRTEQRTQARRGLHARELAVEVEPARGIAAFRMRWALGEVPEVVTGLLGGIAA